MIKDFKSLINALMIVLFTLILIALSIGLIFLIPFVVFTSAETLFNYKITFNVSTVISFWILTIFIKLIFAYFNISLKNNSQGN